MMMGIVPLILLSVIFMIVAYFKTHELKDKEIVNFRNSLIEQKKSELKSIVDVGFSTMKEFYEDKSLDRAEAIAKSMDAIKKLNYDGNNYLFALDYDGKVYYHPNKDLVGKNLNNFKDKGGTYLFQGLAAAARKGGGYVYYVWEKPGSSELGKKLSYALNIPEWNMYIATGFYIDDVDAEVARMSEEFTHETAKTIRYMLIISLLAIAVMTVSAYFFAKQITGGVKKATEMLKDISQGEGDLTRTLDVNSKDEIGLMAEYFNIFIVKLNGIINSVKDSVSHVASASSELAAATEELTITIQDQIGQVSEVAAATEELDTSSHEVQESLNRGVESMNGAVQLTSSGKEMVASSVGEVLSIQDHVGMIDSTVGRLVESSSEIGDIVNVINDIADQTNLLALNAAIEAARAGDQGRGFAVVADEVRKLAERTQGATGEIGKIISGLQGEAADAQKIMVEASSKVKSGVDTITQTEKMFEEVASNITQAGEFNGIIGASVSEQVHTVQNINGNIQAISAGLEQSAPALTEVARTVSDLERQADELKALVESFKTH